AAALERRSAVRERAPDRQHRRPEAVVHLDDLRRGDDAVRGAHLFSGQVGPGFGQGVTVARGSAGAPGAPEDALADAEAVAHQERRRTPGAAGRLPALVLIGAARRHLRPRADAERAGVVRRAAIAVVAGGAVLARCRPTAEEGVAGGF